MLRDYRGVLAAYWVVHAAMTAGLPHVLLQQASGHKRDSSMCRRGLCCGVVSSMPVVYHACELYASEQRCTVKGAARLTAADTAMYMPALAARFIVSECLHTC